MLEHSQQFDEISNKSSISQMLSFLYGPTKLKKRNLKYLKEGVVAGPLLTPRIITN